MFKELSKEKGNKRELEILEYWNQLKIEMRKKTLYSMTDQHLQMAFQDYIIW